MQLSNLGEFYALVAHLQRGSPQLRFAYFQIQFKYVVVRFRTITSPPLVYPTQFFNSLLAYSCSNH